MNLLSQPKWMKTERLQGTNMIKDKEIKKKWMAALRSGKFKQGKHFLHKSEEFCCLGVLCEILEIDSIKVVGKNIFHYRNSVTSLPADLDKEIFDTLDAPHLMRMNDKGETFEVIADYIENFL